MPVVALALNSQATELRVASLQSFQGAVRAHSSGWRPFA
jgi:hypothetical protein